MTFSLKSELFLLWSYQTVDMSTYVPNYDYEYDLFYFCSLTVVLLKMKTLLWLHVGDDSHRLPSHLIIMSIANLESDPLDA